MATAKQDVRRVLDGLVGLRVDELPVEPIAGVCGQLSKEDALGAPVSVAKRMQGIDIAEVMGQSGDEAVAGEAAEPILSGQLTEDFRPIGLDVLG